MEKEGFASSSHVFVVLVLEFVFLRSFTPFALHRIIFSFLNAKTNQIFLLSTEQEISENCS